MPVMFLSNSKPLARSVASTSDCTHPRPDEGNVGATTVNGALAAGFEHGPDRDQPSVPRCIVAGREARAMQEEDLQP